MLQQLFGFTATAAVQLHKHFAMISWPCCCRVAIKTGSRYRYLKVAEDLDERLTELANKLCKASLPLKHQHWAMFAILDAYLCLWQCYVAVKDSKHLQQVCRKPSS